LGATSGLRFHIARCPSCGFAFIADPWVDFDLIYSEQYYAGQGADPLVDYVYETENPTKTIRNYEWRGVLERIGSLVALQSRTPWRAYEGGPGGLCLFAL